MRPLLICYHPDFGRFYNFPKQTRLDSVAESLDMDIVFPTGRWFRAWADKDRRGKPSHELSDFDAMTRNRQVVLAGYSDGAGLANYLASYRSEQVLAVISYAGRLQRPVIKTVHKYPVLDVWNQHDPKRTSRQHQHMETEYKIQRHYVEPVHLQNGWSHWGGWDAIVNERVLAFLRDAKTSEART